MTTIALIAEGITDQAVLENVMAGLVGDDIVVRPLCPLRDATDETRVPEGEFSNWERVLEYVGSPDLVAALSTNDFVVVHLDSDAAEHPNFGVALHVEAKLRSIDEIVAACTAVIHERAAEVSDADHSRILVAVPVLSTECWLLALHNTELKHSAKRGLNCEPKLNNYLSASNKKYEKTYEGYLSLSKGFRKKKELESALGRTRCLELFALQIKEAVT